MSRSFTAAVKQPIRKVLHKIGNRRNRGDSSSNERQWGCKTCEGFIQALNDTLWHEPRTGYGREINFSRDVDCEICSGIRTAWTRVYGTDDFGTAESLLLDRWPLMSGLQVYSLRTRGNRESSRRCIYLLPLDTDDGLDIAGRLVDPHAIDVGLVSKWIHCCDEWHVDTCLPSKPLSLDGIEQLRVIDVQRGCLAYIDASSRYLALSYVWGRVEVLMTLIANLHDLEQENALFTDVFRSQLPLTVKDAMTLTAAVGQQYLWVDALCILQDKDSEEKTRLLPQMDRIYRMAYFTIVAAVGSDANAGLLGFSHDSPRRLPQIVLSYGLNRHLVISQTPFEKWLAEEPSTTVGNCVWNKRGWTLQERLLSCRKLIFLEEGVHFNCGKMTWTEDVFGERQDIRRHFQMTYDFEGVTEDEIWFSGISRKANVPRKKGNYWLRMGDIKVPNWLEYCNLIANLCKREYSYESDILNSFQGIQSTLNSSFLSLYCGLPERFFSLALIWRQNGLSRRRHGDLPSWSWAGWTGVLDVEYLRCACDWMSHEGIMHKFRTSVDTTFYTADDKLGHFIDDWHRYRSLQGLEVDQDLLDELPSGWTAQSRSRTAEILGRTEAADFKHCDDPGVQYIYPIPTTPAPSNVQWTGHILSFHTELADFFISAGFHVYSARPKTVSILDSNGHWCGVLDPDEAIPDSEPESLVRRFVKISTGEVFVGCMNAKNFPEDEYYGYANVPQWHKYVNVIMLRQSHESGPQVQERIGIGRIVVNAWHRAARRPEHIRLS